MSATRNKFSPEYRNRAVRMVEERQGDYPSERAAMSSIAAKVGCTTAAENGDVAQGHSRSPPTPRHQGHRAGDHAKGESRSAAQRPLIDY